MQIILLERVAALGSLGDVVTVKNGYARNFLIPQGKAKRATEANLKEFEARRAELEAKQAAALADAQARQQKLDGQTITIAQKAGVDGRLPNLQRKLKKQPENLSKGFQAAFVWGETGTGKAA